MHTDPAMSKFVSTIFVILILGIVMRRLRQPHVLVYLLTGIILGPSVLGIISNQDTLTRLGAFGVVLLLFFIGMEVSPRRLAENWSISIAGTFLQVIISIAAILAIGLYLKWSISRIVLLGFVISLSSTAVVLKLLDDWKEMNTRVGQDVIGILLVQDLLLVPMIIIIGFFGGQKPSLHIFISQIIGGFIIIALTSWLIIKEEIRLSWLKFLGTEHEMQVFTALGICFGMAFITAITSLSAALGAFVGGMIVSSARETKWVHQSLLSIRTIFIALFFVSIGMLIDLKFVMQFWWQILAVLIATFLTNTLINAGILKALGEQWNVSLYGGSLLSQIGEFSFIIAAVGYQMDIINEKGYQMVISVISLTLLLSPLWIAFVKYLTNMAETKLKRL